MIPISINNVEKLVKKKNEKLVKDLEKELSSQLWKRFSEETGSYDFDICHKDFENYLTASKYIIRKNISKNNFFDDFVFCNLENINELFNKIKDLDDKPSNQDELFELIQSLKIFSYSEEDQSNPLTEGWILHHIFGDVSWNDERYFLIDNGWYKIKDEFIINLNNSCKSFIENHYDENLSETWSYPTEKENDFNAKFISDNPKDNKVLVLDKITPENIELCDILKWDDENIYLYHVKAGFGNTMRDLCSQIFISANKLKNDINSSKDYIEKIYDQLANKKK